MNINLDPVLSTLAPWDLSLTISGQAHTTKRPSIALVARLNSGKMTGTDMRECVGQMFASADFDSPEDATRDWTPEIFLAAMSAYLTYFGSQVVKNSQPIAEAVAAAMGHAVGGKSSST